MNPQTYRYTKEHIWICPDCGKVGITDYAQSQLGEILFVDLLPPGTIVEPGEKIGEVESSKAVSTIASPITGKILDVNQLAIDQPGVINKAPYDDGWLIKLELQNRSELESLMTWDQYGKYIEVLLK